MRAEQSFYDPFTQRAYAPGQKIDPPSDDAAVWLLKHGLASGDAITVSETTNDPTQQTDEQQTEQPIIQADDSVTNPVASSDEEKHHDTKEQATTKSRQKKRDEA